MKFVVCAVRDRAVDGFGLPIFVATEAVAIRSFADEVNRKDSQFAVHPEDFDLYVLGYFEDGKGVFEAPYDCPRQLAIGKSLLRDV